MLRLIGWPTRTCSMTCMICKDPSICQPPLGFTCRTTPPSSRAASFTDSLLPTVSVMPEFDLATFLRSSLFPVPIVSNEWQIGCSPRPVRKPTKSVHSIPCSYNPDGAPPPAPLCEDGGGMIHSHGIMVSQLFAVSTLLAPPPPPPFSITYMRPLVRSHRRPVYSGPACGHRLTRELAALVELAEQVVHITYISLERTNAAVSADSAATGPPGDIDAHDRRVSPFFCARLFDTTRRPRPIRARDLPDTPHAWTHNRAAGPPKGARRVATPTRTGESTVGCRSQQDAKLCVHGESALYWFPCTPHASICCSTLSCRAVVLTLPTSSPPLHRSPERRCDE